MHIDDLVINEIISRIKKYESVEKVVLFGSRARGDNAERSDYDIAVYGNVSSAERGELNYFCLEEVRTLRKIDLIFVNANIYPKLRDNIEKEGVVLYERNC